jgi:hypothetical protein
MIAVFTPPQLESASTLELNVLSTMTLARMANQILLATEPLLAVNVSVLVAIYEPQIYDANPVTYDETPDSSPLPKGNTKLPVVYMAPLCDVGAAWCGHGCLFLTLLLLLIMVIQLGGGGYVKGNLAIPNNDPLPI